MGKVYAELGLRNRIDVNFAYDKRKVALIREVEGRRFVETPPKHWTVPKDLETCRTLREKFGSDLEIGPNLRSWAKEQVRQENQLGSIASATEGELEFMPDLLPELYEAFKNRPYQIPGTKFLAQAPNPLCADQPGLGKTLETIGAVFESQMHEGSHLIVAPKTSLETVWEYELLRWQPYPVFVAEGTKRDREKALDRFFSTDGPKWLVVNPGMVQYRKNEVGPVTVRAKPKDWKEACKCDMMKDPHWHYIDPFGLTDFNWSNVIVDEAHKGAVRNPGTITAMAMYALQSLKRYALTGTPITKNSMDLWGILHYLNPKVYSSKWTWAERYCVIEKNDAGYKKIKGFREDRKEALYRSLIPYVLRRTKEEVLPDLPPKQFIDIWVNLEGKQEKQYKTMENDGAVRISGASVAAGSVLAEFIRLQQFANALCTIDKDGDLIPTNASAKLDALMQLLEERGIFDINDDPAQAEKVVVFSQFEKYVTMIVEELRKKGVEVARITGKENKRGQRRDIQNAFQQDGGTQVLVMTTTAGGVAITLDRADTVIFMDETWTFSDMEQAEDRVHRASRMHQVFIYVIRARDTIDEYKMEVVDEKEEMHTDVMDIRRKFLADYRSKAAS